jgi:hypothetical protein
MDIEGELYSNKNKSGRQNSGAEKEKRALFDAIGVEVCGFVPNIICLCCSDNNIPFVMLHAA